MIKVEYGEVLEGRERILDSIRQQKISKNFKVVDVGGAAVGWAAEVVDVFIDINHSSDEKKQFVFDICKEKDWQQVVDYVDEFGKFDFAICTHTLEDVYNPYVVLDHLPRISNSGIITMPSVKTEINLVESENWSGFLHHRYMFGYEDGEIVIIPKLPIVEKIGPKKVLRSVEEIRFTWERDLKYKIFMDNYLGPDIQTVLRNLEEFFNKNR